MKSLIALLAFVSVPAFAADTYTCTAANPTDRVQTVTFEIGQTGPVDYAKIDVAGRNISAVPIKMVTADGVTTYSMSTPTASYVINIAANGDTSIWIPSNSNFMTCHK